MKFTNDTKECIFIMRFIKNLSPETISLLRRISKSSKNHRVRQRAHCIILSNEGHTCSDLMGIFDVSLVTIYNWFNDWEKCHLISLYDKPRSGRISKLSEEQIEEIKKWTKSFPKNIGRVCALVEETYKISVSKKTIKRILKMLDFNWLRIHKKVKGEPDEMEYNVKKQQLED
ncbi:transposase [Candidatus Magnetobacterium bavaricum]|uniref:Transposase n=1 Tax=Candidatus Magnetobacterium bavaricum TaxID=29290 RepID=A0A0F3GWZ2_9BACT|nr:transposase [Candidatus Magnetobacterium bavaricum]